MEGNLTMPRRRRFSNRLMAGQPPQGGRPPCRGAEHSNYCGLTARVALPKNLPAKPEIRGLAHSAAPEHAVRKVTTGMAQAVPKRRRRPPPAPALAAVPRPPHILTHPQRIPVGAAASNILSEALTSQMTVMWHRPTSMWVHFAGSTRLAPAVLDAVCAAPAWPGRKLPAASPRTVAYTLASQRPAHVQRPRGLLLLLCTPGRIEMWPRPAVQAGAVGRTHAGWSTPGRPESPGKDRVLERARLVAR